jgi:hypothetical protein
MSMTVPSAAVVQSVEELPAPRGLKGLANGDAALTHWRSSGKAEGQTTVASVGLRIWNRPERRRLSAVTDMDVSKLQSQSGYRFHGETDVRVSGRQPRAKKNCSEVRSYWQPRCHRFPLRPVALRPLLSKGVPFSKRVRIVAQVESDCQLRQAKACGFCQIPSRLQVESVEPPGCRTRCDGKVQ